MKKIKFAPLLLFAIPIGISAISIPIIVSNSRNTNLNYTNLFSTFDNILDNLISLGYVPDYHTMSNSGKTKYASYLSNYVNDNLTEYVNILIRNGQEIDRTAINNLKANTVILNENMKTSVAPKFDGIINNIAYSSRGDSAQARDFTTLNIGGYEWISTNSVNNALLIQAKSLDSIYPSYSFDEIAEKIVELNKKRISFIYENNKSFISNKTIGVIYANSVDSTQIDKNFYICSPYTYSMLYSKNEIGIGFDFPTPNSLGFINRTHGYYDTSWRIMADTGDELINQFLNKFDFLIYCAPDTLSDSETTQFKEKLYSSNLKKMLKNQNSYETNLIYSTIGEWYTPAWANIGMNYILDYVVNKFSLKDLSNDEKWIPTKKEDLKKIRKI